MQKKCKTAVMQTIAEKVLRFVVPSSEQEINTISLNRVGGPN